MPKQYLTISVLDAAKDRLRRVFSDFDNVYVSFSGGKDSGLLLNLALEVSKEFHDKPLPVLLVDLEGQYRRTIEYAHSMMSRPDVEPYWVCLPLHLRNAVSQIQPHWICWDESKKDAWIRPLPKCNGVIHDEKFFPFFQRGMEFEDFVPLFGDWLSGGKQTACLVGIRSDESLNRFRTIRNEHKEPWKNWMWTTRISPTTWNAYPIYDWTTRDIWIANGKFKYPYNTTYDLMHLAGLSIHQMRLCQPYGDDQRKGLYLFKMLEPETWAKVVSRVEGANFGNRYSEGQSHVLGNFKVALPDGHTYKSYAKFLLATMPPHLSAHYRTKICVFLRWWKKHRHDIPAKAVMQSAGVLPDWRRGFPDSVDSKLESGTAVIDGVRCRLPSWRRICKTLLKNDYWCKGLSFSQTKKEMERQLARIARFQTPIQTDSESLT